MPELPEVEILVRHLAPLLAGQSILHIEVLQSRAIRPHSPDTFIQSLTHASILRVHRRAKYLCFDYRPHRSRTSRTFLGHLGMTGRMDLLPSNAPSPRHTALRFQLRHHSWIFNDPRTFGRISLDPTPLLALGPEPLSDAFHPAALAVALQTSRQPVKVRLMDQSVVAGLGNIYASEALHRARIDPHRPSHSLRPTEITRAVHAIRACLQDAIELGARLHLDFRGEGPRDGLFYYGQSTPSAPGQPLNAPERFRVYDREDQPCPDCLSPIRRSVQAGRSTFYCPICQT